MAANFSGFDDNVLRECISQMLRAVVWAVPAQPSILVTTGQSSVLPTYFSVVDWVAILFSSAPSGFREA